MLDSTAKFLLEYGQCGLPVVIFGIHGDATYFGEFKKIVVVGVTTGDRRILFLGQNREAAAKYRVGELERQFFCAVRHGVDFLFVGFDDGKGEVCGSDFLVRHGEGFETMPTGKITKIRGFNRIFRGFHAAEGGDDSLLSLLRVKVTDVDKGHSARVIIISVKVGEGGAGGGLDDFLSADGEAFRQ